MRWPDGEVVEADIRELAPPGGGTSFEVSATPELASGWYGIRVRAGEGVALGYGRGHLVIEPGREVVSRFGVGRAPRLAAVSAELDGRVTLRFSERVTVPEGALSIAQDGVACLWPASHDPVLRGVELPFTCSAPWPATLDVRVGTAVVIDGGEPVLPVSFVQRMEVNETAMPGDVPGP